MKSINQKQFKRLAYIVLSIIFLLTLFWGSQLKHTTLNYNFEEFFPASDEDGDFFYNHRKRFGSDNDFLLIAIHHSPGIFDSTFLADVHSFSKEISEIPHIKFTRDITQENEFFIYNGGLTGERPYIDLENTDLKTSKATIFKNKELITSLVAKNEKSLVIFVQHEDYLSKAKSDSLLSALHQLTETYNFERVSMAGRTIGQQFYIDTMTDEMATYVGLSIVLVVLFLIIAFHSLWGLIVPLIVIVCTMVWIIGFMGWIGEPINILLVTLPSIMFVVAMSDVIHLVSKYIELIREGLSKFDAIKVAYKEIGVATFLTSITTAIGFFTLVFVEVIPIQVFGKFVGIGVLIAFIITFTTLPFFFFFTKKPKVAEKKSRSFWYPFLHRSFLWTLKNRKKILLGTGVLLVVFIWGMTNIVSNNYIMDDISPNAPLKKDFDYFDENYGGVRPFELSVELKNPEKSLWDLSVLNQIKHVETYLTATYGVVLNTSLTQVLSVLNRSSHAGDSAFYQLPEKQRSVNRFKRMLKTADGGDFIYRLVDSTETYTRLSGGIPDWGNIENAKRNEALLEFIANNTNQEELHFQLTGSAHLLDKNMRYLSSSLVKGLVIAIIIVALIMGLLFRSAPMIIIAIIPNVIPLLFIAAIMGFFGIHLKITTAIVFTIAFGIAVDDTIHFLSKFKLEMNKGRSPLYALKRTFITTGKAIILTSLILCSGFLLLLLSEFKGTFYMGLMVTITLFFAVIVDLLILPILLMYQYNRPSKTTKKP